MQIYSSFPDSFSCSKSVISIGSFDGLHIGHQAILKILKQKAQDIHGESVIITFDPHPRSVLEPRDTSFKLLTLTEEKKQLFEKAGIDHVFFIPFTKELAQTSSKSFVQDFLVDRLHVNTLVIGYNHRFGIYREGNFKKLQDLGEALNFSVLEVEEQCIDNHKVSSTLIRNSIREGNITLANQWLGRPYFLNGRVVIGNQMGRRLDYPTANIKISPLKLMPATGVYASMTEYNGTLYKSMTYIGNRPTLDNAKPTIETHLFDFSDDIYGTDIIIHFIKRTREQIRFNSTTELQAQLALDREQILEILKTI